VRAIVNDGVRKFMDVQKQVIEKFDRGELDQKAAQLEIEHFWAGALRRAGDRRRRRDRLADGGPERRHGHQEQSTAEIIKDLIEEALQAIAGSPQIHLRLAMTEAPGLTGARMLLKRLRNVMARGGAAQLRLDQTVKLIAARWWRKSAPSTCCAPARCWSCSPPKGLKKEAVHKTRLRVGEGLVGDIASHARPWRLADAQHHPQFAYRPGNRRRAVSSR
jgi:hypothetical protein